MLLLKGDCPTTHSIDDHFQGGYALFVYGVDRHGHPLQFSDNHNLAAESGVRGSLIMYGMQGAGTGWI